MNDKKNILLVHRFFYPDTPPYAIILDDMKKTLLENGYMVDVLSSQPSYKSVDMNKKEKIITHQDDNSTIYRLPVFRTSNQKINKLVNFFWFPVMVFFFILFSRKYDVIIVSTNPPVILAFFTALATKLKASKLIYHCMDIYPEIGKLSGDFSNKYIYALLLWMDNFTCSVANKIIVLSEDMKQSFLAREDKNISEIKIETINNYDLSDGESLQADYFDNKKVKRIVFTGNLGRFQNLDKLIFSIKNYSCLNDFELIFVGEGIELKNLKQMAQGLECVKFIPHQSIATARKIISEADMGIVSLQRDIIKYAYPSKTMTYLSEGTPILGLVETGTDLADFIESNNLGKIVSSDNIQNIYEVFKKLSERSLHFDRKMIKSTFENNFSKIIYEDKFLKLFNSLVEAK